MTEIDFASKKFTIVRGAVESELINFIKPYFLLNEIKNPSMNDVQVPTAFSSYGDPMTETLLSRLQNIIEKNTQLDLLPTYSYYRNYRLGDVLHPHLDRPACEISATLCLGYSYDDSEYAWPIFVDGIGYELKPGDIAIYRGIECTHWRNKFNPPNPLDYQIQTFLHYVDANGPYVDWKFDKRKGLGHAKEYI